MEENEVIKDEEVNYDNEIPFLDNGKGFAIVVLGGIAITAAVYGAKKLYKAIKTRKAKTVIDPEVDEDVVEATVVESE